MSYINFELTDDLKVRGVWKIVFDKENNFLRIHYKNQILTSKVYPNDMVRTINEIDETVTRNNQRLRDEAMQILEDWHNTCPSCKKKNAETITTRAPRNEPERLFDLMQCPDCNHKWAIDAKKHNDFVEQTMKGFN
jgi:DNA-directed RNA polymerase subunit M/transcription elongation factor TFIIS